VQNQRPFARVTVNDKTKETELGDWAKDTGEWRFREILTLEVSPSDEITVQLYCATKYELWLASLSLTSRRVGEVCFPVSGVLPKLRQEDRDTEGIFYVTPVLSFDTVYDGRNTGRVFLSFETTQAPPSTKAHIDRWCSPWSGRAATYEREDDDDVCSGVTDLDNSCRSSIYSIGHPAVNAHSEIASVRPAAVVWRAV